MENGPWKRAGANGEKKAPEENGGFRALPFALELGYMIAIPLVAFALLGRFADNRWGTSPLFLLAGILLSIILSVAIINKKVSALMK